MLLHLVDDLVDVVNIPGSSISLLLGDFLLERGSLLIASRIFLLFRSSLGQFVPLFLGYLLILELLGLQLFQPSISSLLLDDSIELLVFLHLIPFDDFQFSHVSGRALIEELVFHDIVDLVVSSLILVRLFGLDIIYVGENGFGLEILRFVSGAVPVSELVLVVLVLILNLS